MEFTFTAEEQVFARKSEFLRDHPPDICLMMVWMPGYGSGAHSHAFMRQLAARGWLSMCWPREYGGQARPFMYKLILLEEPAAAGAPFGPLGGQTRCRRDYPLWLGALKTGPLAACGPRRHHVLAGI